MLVGLDGECLETPFPQMSTRAVLAMIAPHMSRHQPLHPSAQIPVFVRPKNQVKMVGQEAPPQHTHGHFDGGVAHRFEKCLVVSVLEKDASPAVAAIEDV